MRGQVAIVTGAAGGLGFSIAERLGGCGARVALLDADEQRGKQAVQTLVDRDVEAVFVHCDTSLSADVASAFERVDDFFEGLDILVTCAGIREIASAANLDPAEWDRVIAVNLSGPFYCAQQAAARMAQRGGGVIVNIASVAGLIGMTQRPAYTASKHGLVGLTKNLARDFAELGVRVNAVAPGTVRTPMTEAYYQDEEFLRGVEGIVPLGFEGTCGDVADAVLFLCSRLASWITGVVLPVDGGWLAEKNYAPRGDSAAYTGRAGRPVGT